MQKIDYFTHSQYGDSLMKNGYIIHVAEVKGEPEDLACIIPVTVHRVELSHAICTDSIGRPKLIEANLVIYDLQTAYKERDAVAHEIRSLRKMQGHPACSNCGLPAGNGKTFYGLDSAYQFCHACEVELEVNE